MFLMTLFLVGSGVFSVLLIIFSSLSGSKRSDETIANMLRKRQNKSNGLETESENNAMNQSPSVETIEFLRELYPEGTVLTLVDVTRGAKLLTDIKVYVTKVDEFGQIHCKLEEGDVLTLDPETDTFQLLNV